jgi:hypothetical protein
MITVTEPIPDTFHVKYNFVFLGEKTYPLILVIHQLKTEQKPNLYTLELKVMLPDDYPDTEYKKAQARIAYLLMHYDIIKKNLDIDLFFVYPTTERYKKLIRQQETFHTKGLGKYMLCRAIHYLLMHHWFDIHSTATLTAAGGECFYKELVDAFTYEQCMAILKPYPDLLFEFVILNYNSVLRAALHIPNGFILYSYYETHKSQVNSAVMDILHREQHNPELLRLLRKTVCEVKTNHDLIEKNYKKYGFEVTQDNGLQAEMQGSVYSILSECIRHAIKEGRKKSSINDVIIQDNLEKSTLLGRKRKSRKRRKSKCY